tara:strand:- start:135 stop:518 length:384 start_codon:yes stop_codon:yes gene_type:complete
VLGLISCGGPSGPPPDAPPPYPPTPFGGFGVQGKQHENQSPAPERLPSGTDVLTLEALGEVWVLVQDAQGIELQWKNLREGEQMPIAKNGPISVTCSNGNALRILGKKGKSLAEPKESKGIAIIRLP